MKKQCGSALNPTFKEPDSKSGISQRNVSKEEVAGESAQAEMIIIIIREKKILASLPTLMPNMTLCKSHADQIRFGFL